MESQENRDLITWKDLQISSQQGEFVNFFLICFFGSNTETAPHKPQLIEKNKVIEITA